MNFKWKLIDGSPITLRLRKGDVEKIIDAFTPSNDELVPCNLCSHFAENPALCRTCRIGKQMPHPSYHSACGDLGGIEDILVDYDDYCLWERADHLKRLKNFRRRIGRAAKRST